jgi:hypothetical protein
MGKDLEGNGSGLIEALDRVVSDGKKIDEWARTWKEMVVIEALDRVVSDGKEIDEWGRTWKEMVVA